MDMERSRIDATDLTEDGGILIPPEIEPDVRSMTGRLCSITMQDGSTINFVGEVNPVENNEIITKDNVPEIVPVEYSATFDFTIIDSANQEHIETILADEMSYRFAEETDDMLINGRGLEPYYDSIEPYYDSIEVSTPPKPINCECSILTSKLLEPIRLIRED
jgi:hypothetical protein